MEILNNGNGLPQGISLLWLWAKIAVYLIITMISLDVVVIAYQQF